MRRPETYQSQKNPWLALKQNTFLVSIVTLIPWWCRACGAGKKGGRVIQTLP